MGDARNLPSVEFAVGSGLRSKFNPRENDGKFYRLLQNADTFREWNAVGKVPGSSRRSDQHPGPVVTLHFHEYTTVQGVRAREVISGSQGNLYRVNADRSLTTIANGLTAEPMAAITMLDRLHLSSRGQLGIGTGGVKWDGANVRSWGLIAPGLRRIAFLSFDDASVFTPSAQATLSTNVATIHGGASVQMDKSGTGATDASMSIAGLSLNLSGGSDELYIFLNVPTGALQKLKQSGTAVEVRYGGAGLTNANRHEFSVGDLRTGWNLLSWLKAAPSTVDGSGATLSNVHTFQLRLIFASAGETQDGFLWDLFFQTDRGKIAPSVGSSGAVTGTRRYRATYVSENGVESNAGPVSASVTLTAQRATLTSIPVANDPQIVARRIYCDVSGDAIWRFNQQLDDNFTTVSEDNVPDASLGSAQPPLAGDLSLDHSPPEAFVDVETYNNRAWGILASDRRVLWPSNSGEPETFALVDQLLFEEELVGVEAHAAGLLAYATDKLYLVTGGRPGEAIDVREATNQVGANGFRAKFRVKGTNLAIREKEVFFISDPSDPWLINGPVLDAFEALDTSLFANAHGAHDRSRYRIVIFSEEGAAFVYQYGTTGYQEITGLGPGTDPQDLRVGNWRTLALPASVVPLCSEMVERAADLPELWAGAEDGYIYFLQDPEASDWATQLTSEPVETILEPYPVPIGVDEGRGEVRFLEFTVFCDAATTWQVTVTLFDDAGTDALVSRAFDFEFPAGSSNHVIPMPAIGARAAYATIRLRNASSGGSGRFRKAKLYYIPRGDFSGGTVRADG